MNMQDNLDWKAQKASQTIVAFPELKANDIENMATKALGVIQENGLYASMLFLFSRTRKIDKDSAGKIREVLLKIGNDLVPGKPSLPYGDARATLVYLSDHVCKDLDTTLLVKALWEQTLIYTRYGAKARKNSES